MGVMPSYSSNEAGLKVDGVSEGKPAQRLAFKRAIFIKISDLDVKDVQTYMDALVKFKKGKPFPVKFSAAMKELDVERDF